MLSPRPTSACVAPRRLRPTPPCLVPPAAPPRPASRRLYPRAVRAASFHRCRAVYSDLLVHWGLIVPLAEITKFGGGGGQHAPWGSPCVPPGLASGTICVSVGHGEWSAGLGRSRAGSLAASLGGLGGNLAGGTRADSFSSLGGPGCWYVEGSSAATPPGKPSPRCSMVAAEAGQPSKCAVCHLRVRGLAWHCGSCGHGGHLACMRDWLRVGDVCGVCPTGCGCCCLYAVEPVVEPEAAPGTPDSPHHGSCSSRAARTPEALPRTIPHALHSPSLPMSGAVPSNTPTGKGGAARASHRRTGSGAEHMSRGLSSCCNAPSGSSAGSVGNLTSMLRGLASRPGL